jgi:hypothetical protein
VLCPKCRITGHASTLRQMHVPVPSGAYSCFINSPRYDSKSIRTNKFDCPDSRGVKVIPVSLSDPKKNTIIAVVRSRIVSFYLYCTVQWSISTALRRRGARMAKRMDQREHRGTIEGRRIKCQLLYCTVISYCTVHHMYEFSPRSYDVYKPVPGSARDAMCLPLI